MNGIFYIIESCEYVEYFKVRFLMAKLLTDHNQNSVIRNEKWQIDQTNAINNKCQSPIAIIKYFVDCSDFQQ